MTGFSRGQRRACAGVSVQQCGRVCVCVDAKKAMTGRKVAEDDMWLNFMLSSIFLNLS